MVFFLPDRVKVDQTDVNFLRNRDETLTRGTDTLSLVGCIGQSSHVSV